MNPTPWDALPDPWDTIDLVEWIDRRVESVYASPSLGSCWIRRCDQCSYSIDSINEDGTYTLIRGDGLTVTITLAHIRRYYKPT